MGAAFLLAGLDRLRSVRELARERVGNQVADAGGSQQQGHHAGREVAPVEGLHHGKGNGEDDQDGTPAQGGMASARLIGLDDRGNQLLGDIGGHQLLAYAGIHHGLDGLGDADKQGYRDEVIKIVHGRFSLARRVRNRRYGDIAAGCRL